jgi:hypothetical protein
MPSCRALIDPSNMTRDEFIAAHVKVCTCPQLKKYDKLKPAHTLHSLAYSRRKCAKELWKSFIRRGKVLKSVREDLT